MLTIGLKELIKNYMKTKFAIGCLIQWYECDIIEEYVESLKDSLDEYDGEVIVDFTACVNQNLEKCINTKQLKQCEDKIKNIISDKRFKVKITEDLVTISDYRRKFNTNYCDKVDVLMWGESDALIPKNTFVILDNLHQISLQNNNPKYLAFFGTCKMWDNSWLPLEHPDFTNKPFYDKPEQFKSNHWWSLRYTMTKDEMNKINNKTNELDVRIIPQHKFNGCGLVISSEVIRSGVNIPKSVFFVHEDTAFMHVTNKVLGNIPQYIIKNVLLVHNRNHPNKRMHIKGEIKDGTMNEKRRSNNWYTIANKLCEQNCYNIFNPNFKSFTWKDVFKSKIKIK
mgnify:FL=1|tara:strand:+ start:4038 stop:5054 length:1017 start_codon:yes stop_codon:yes gene_type:complete